MRHILFGLVFASLWASASVATKVGLVTNQPLIIADIRFFLAGLLLLVWAYRIQGARLPNRAEWRALAIYGLLNVTIYLGAFILALKEVTAGIGTLAVGTNPLMIGIVSAVWLRRPIRLQEWTALLLGLLGVGIATWPLLQQAQATWWGIGVLTIGMLSYSIGTVYYSSVQWNLPITVINGWQVFFGGLFLLPLTLLMSDFSQNAWDWRFWVSMGWLAIPVSIGAVQLWLYLLKIDPVRSALWLYLCPIFGFLYAWVFLDEPLTGYTAVGTVLVLVALWWGRRG